MCGRFVSTTEPAVLAERFEAAEVRADDQGRRYNVAPTDAVYAVAEGKDGTRRLGTFKWGLVPFWAKDPKVGSRMINARMETLASKFTRTLERRRCIIPADGFYEWQHREEGDTRPKQPFFIHRKDGEPMAFAGLWEVWHDPDHPDAEPLRTCSIITTDANQVVARTHDRMPVMLPPEAWKGWLDVDQHDLDAVQALLVPAPAAELEVYPVHPHVNSVKNDGPHLVEPLEGHEPSR
jgi:putative SOS response-associated peptidase YedK